MLYESAYKPGSESDLISELFSEYQFIISQTGFRL